MISTMTKVSHKAFLASLVAVVSTHAGMAVSRVDAPPPAHADLEASAEMPMPPAGWGEGVPSRINLRLTLSLDATQTNNAEIEIGETIVGWDCGQWFVRGDRLREHLTAGGGATGSRTLAVRIEMNRANTLERVTFRADGKAVDFGEGLVPAWFDPDTFDTLRVTSRGGAQNVFATAKWHVDGTVMILR
jgi:hypothetical protein